MPSWCPPEMRSFLVHTGQNLGVWADACERVL
jgi:hypothetical protein